MPEHSVRRPLGRLGVFSRGRGGTKSDERSAGMPCVRYGELYTQHGEVIRSFASFIDSNAAHRYSPLQPGDVVFAASGETHEEIGKAAAYCGTSTVRAGADTIIFRPSAGVDAKFLGYALATEDAQRFRARFGQGSSVIHIAAAHLRNLEVWLPPLPEQRQIAEILDTIDVAIRKTEQIIAKLKQVKQGLLHDLLTRGIDDNGELRDPERHPEQFKDSPLGRIPKAWQVANVGSSVAAIVDYRGSTPPYSSAGIPVISQEDVQADGLMPATKWVSPETYRKWQHRGVLHADDVVFRMERFVGEVVRVPSNQLHVVTRGVLALRARRELSTQAYLFWFLHRKKRIGEWDGHNHGTTVPRMYKPDLLRERLAFAPLAEQSTITQVLDLHEQRLRVERERVAKLRLLKKGLMEDLLTGRVRVTKLLEAAAE